jgi:6-phosphogluconate dehydrogenase
MTRFGAAPAAVDTTIGDLVPHLSPGDIMIDGGNSHYVGDLRRAKELPPKGIHYLDFGTSGGVWGRERGYCLMVGGEEAAVKHLDPVFGQLAPGRGDVVRTLGTPRAANIGKRRDAVDFETTPLRDPEHYRYEFNLPEIAEVWRRGSVVASWLLDQSAAALIKGPEFTGFQGRVSDSGETRWTIKAAIDEAVPAPVLSTALYERFSSRGAADFGDTLLSAMRHEFGGHLEKAPE